MEPNTKYGSHIRGTVTPRGVKIGVKKVTNVRKGGILIETVNDADLDKLISELDSNPEIKNKFDIGKPLQRNPQIICYGVSPETTEDTITNCTAPLTRQAKDIKILHNFKGARGRNWIFESTPEVFKLLSKTTKINIGWERNSYKEYIRPRQCFKCCKFGHPAKHCKETKD
ncbi:CCHC-type domain-containing protein [Caerostris extrusa]|uniref:CCHC-type domain-containing protein n=1 Tax=Caerostris extrusa TaxID=172846 RepID=A0AAV4MY75_CAEEX|nr:CCHC-type domain-containing protein [Caerostris extrusa]